jgi:hypothetical protein
MTFHADKLNVVQEIAALIEDGTYPEDLTSWFQHNT